MTDNQTGYNYWSSVAIFWVSVAVISLQLILMRAFSVSHYYHFSYLVISTGLLGFGAGGTFLALFYDLLKRHFFFWNLFFHLCFLLSIPASYTLAQSIPVDTQYILYSGEQVGLLLAHNLLLFIPFFFGGTIIGFMLSFYKKEVPVLYAANLAGSGLGGIFALVLMFLAPAFQLPAVITPLVLFGMACFWVSGFGQSTVSVHAGMGMLFLGLGGTVLALLSTPPDSVDPYKSLAHFRQLERQGDAEHVAMQYGPRGQIDVYSAPSFHYTLFAGPLAGVLPPDQLALLIDGEVAGAVFSIEDREEAAILDHTPQSIPYRLLNSPDVLLLGETGGANIWLAKRMGAERITVVQPNPRLYRLLRNDLFGRGGAVFDDEQVEVVISHPRHFLEKTERRFDLIHIAGGESMAAGTGGLQGLHEDYLLTVEAIAKARERLSREGMISITRGIQSPPRDNLKIISMFAEAVSEFSGDQPEDHLLMSRNYLAANTLLTAKPVSGDRIGRFLDVAGTLRLDLEYYPGIDGNEISQINVIEGPADAEYSYIHHGIRQILFGDAGRFYEDWSYNVRAPRDDTPYFNDFFTWRSLDRFLETYGENWFQRVELGYAILFITFIQLAVVAVLFIIAPLLFRLPTYLASPNKMATLIYFSCIGLGFMFLEITFIQIFTNFLGDPIISASAILTSVLVFSGLGSAIHKKTGLIAVHRMRVATVAIFLTAACLILFSAPVLNIFIAAGTPWRYLITVLMLMPVSFFMGWMFPSGMKVLEQRSEVLIPWAWGVNGFASVIAAPLAILLSMSIGFGNVLWAGIGCYLLAGLTSWMWKKPVLYGEWQ